MPMLTGGLAGRWNVTEKLDVNLRIEMCYREFDKLAGFYQEALFSVYHSTFKHEGFGL